MLELGNYSRIGVARSLAAIFKEYIQKKDTAGGFPAVSFF